MKSVYTSGGGREEALNHLSQVAIETVPKDIESYMFVNMKSGSSDGVRSEIA